MEPRDKQCAVCGVKQSLENSSLNDSGSYRSRCNACRSAQNKRRGETTEGFFTRRHSDLKARHKRNNYKGDAITRDELIELYKAQDGMCAISGLPMHTTTKNTDLSASPDRVDVSRGYEKDNVRLVCSRANVMRNALDDYELVWWCRAIVNAHEKR